VLDLSNNNEAVDFHRLRQLGHSRVYLKRSEGVNFIDHKHDDFHRRALAAGFKVGAYHFAHPEQNGAKAEAEYFARLLPRRIYGHTLRPCLDLEAGVPDKATAAWAVEFLAHLHSLTGRRGLLYSNPSYLQECGFTRAPAPLWLAAYGRDDGREHPYVIPNPWTKIAAHQYASTARIPGVVGSVDLSKVKHPRLLDELRLGRMTPGRLL
jgi:GH25 family lysozyme M1 (1,4-beta-N-acetylmuramidase)